MKIKHAILAALATLLTACDLPPYKPDFYWLVCDGNPLIRSSSWAELKNVPRGYWVEHDQPYPVYAPLERYNVCKIIPESDLHPAILERAR